MAAPTVYEDVAAGADVNGTLFAEKKFWVAQRVPLRATLLNTIRTNGGQIVAVEKQADYMIADHFKPKHCPPGSISYTFIEQSLKDGALADPAQHRAGPPLGETRDAGSRMRPAKSIRVPYTAEEDRTLYQWVQDSVASGSGTKGTESGNQIYMELEKKYPRHTWQSYRDHYLKKLKHNPPPPDQPAPPNASEASTGSTSNQTNGDSNMGTGPSKATASKPAKKSSSTGKSYSLAALRALFDDEDYDKVYAATEAILERREDGEKKYIRSWTDLAATTKQTADEWMEFFEKIVLPQWQKDSTPKKDAVKARVFSDTEIQEEEDGTEDQETAEAETSTPTSNTGKATGSTSKPRANGSTLFDAYLAQFIEERRGRGAAEAYMFWTRDENGARKLAIWDDHPEMARTELHQMLRPIWEVLSDAEKQKYQVMEDADRRRLELEEVQLEQLEEVDVAKENKQQQPPQQQKHIEEQAELMETSSTVAQETPDYIRKAHTNLMKRIYVESDPFSKDHDPSRYPKRRKRSSSPAARKKTAQVNVLGIQNKPLEISSTVSSSFSEMDFEEPPDHKGNFEAMIQAQLDADEDQNEVMDDADKPTQSIEFPNAPLEDADVDDKIEPEHLDSESMIPPDAPSPPQQQKRKAPTFDTQAILESESQDLPLQPLPPPPPQAETQAGTSPRDRSQSIESSASSEDLEISALPPPQVSPPPEIKEEEESDEDDHGAHAPPESEHISSRIPVPSHEEASSQSPHTQQQPENATQSPSPSPQPQSQSPTLISLPPPAPTTPPQKAKSSTHTTSKPSAPASAPEDDDDPDPPLHPTEFPAFDAEQYAEGFTYSQIRAALKMTGCRPVLAVAVLDAWKAGESVPEERGVWTETDDGDLYAGLEKKRGHNGDRADRGRLERVVRKHGRKGWGGVEERMDFLERLGRRTRGGGGGK